MIMTIWLELYRYCPSDVMACVPICDDPTCVYVILIHCLALVISSLGGIITGGWHKWIMEMDITMMNRYMEMEIPKVIIGYTKL